MGAILRTLGNLTAGVPGFFKGLNTKNMTEYYLRAGNYEIKQNQKLLADTAGRVNQIEGKLKRSGLSDTEVEDYMKFHRVDQTKGQMIADGVNKVGRFFHNTGMMMGMGTRNTIGAVGDVLKATAPYTKEAAKAVGTTAAVGVGAAAAPFAAGGALAAGAAVVGGVVAKDIVETLGRETAKVVKAGAQHAWKNRAAIGPALNSNRGQAITWGVGGVGAVVAYNAGTERYNRSARLSDTQVDPTSGGTFLTPQFAPATMQSTQDLLRRKDAPQQTIDSLDFGAGGDLVFALHNLRNGG